MDTNGVFLMDIELIYIFKIAFIIIYLLGVFVVAKREYLNKNKFSIIYIIAFSLLFGFISYNCGSSGGLDRARYFMHYAIGNNVSQSQSPGLNFFFVQCRELQLNGKEMMALFSSIFMFALLIAYKYSKYTDPFALLCLLFSTYLVYGFSIIKQGFSQSLITLAFVAYFTYVQGNFVHRGIKWLSVVFLLICGCMFHAAGYLILIIFAALCFWNNSAVRKFGYFCLPVLLFLFEYVLTIFLSESETLDSQFGGYEDSTEASFSLKLFKSVPFYVVTIVAINYRSFLKTKIRDFEKYLFISCCCSLFGLLCVYNYWFFRFSLFLYFPFFTFMSLMKRHLSTKKNGMFFINLSFVLFVLLDIKLYIQYFFKFGGL